MAESLPADTSFSDRPGPTSSRPGWPWFSAWAWLLGALASAFLSFPSELWLALLGSACLVMLIMLFRRRHRATRSWALLAVVFLAAAWTDLHLHRLPTNHVQRCITDSPQLVELEGLIADTPRIAPPATGAFASFAFWMSPQTIFTLDCRALRFPHGWQSLSGRLLVHVDQADHRLHPGQRLRLIGLLTPPTRPANPGQELLLSSRAPEIAGRLFIKDPASIQILPPNSWTILAPVHSFLPDLRRSARHWLALGLEHNPQALALVQALVLGQSSPELTRLRPAFQHTGLAHILAISGAHLTILLALVWGLFRCGATPPRAARLTLLVLLIYLVLLPPRVPILRASIMAGLFLLAWGFARRPHPLDLLSLAFLIVLIWHPADLWTAGFQLSFAVTAALLAFTVPLLHRWGVSWRLLVQPTPVSTPLLPSSQPAPSPVAHQASGFFARTRLYFLTALAANLTGFLSSLPLIAWHFHQISPLAVFWSLLVLPLVSLVLALAFAKLLLTSLIPTLGRCLAHLLEPLTDLLIHLIQTAAHLPGTVVLLKQPPPLAWVLAVAAVILAWLAGYFLRRPLALLTSLLLLAAWLTWHQQFSWWDRWPGNPVPTQETLLRLHVLSVGDGNAQVLVIPSHRRLFQFSRLPDDFVLLYDCGSRDRPDLGERTVAPALVQLGLRRINLAMISHPDMDHFSGLLDLADRIPISRVLLSPHFLDHARQHPRGSAAFLLAGLDHRRISYDTAVAGWSLQHGPVQLTLLWPPADRSFSTTNDASLVLRIDAAGRSFLLTGDIQQEAIHALLVSRSNLRTDVMDLPHHGSFVAASPAFLAAASPRLVLQSSSAARLQRDRWAPLLQQTGIPRLAAAQTGMISLVLDRTGSIHCTTYRPSSISPFRFPSVASPASSTSSP